MANTRSAAALELWRPHLEGAVVAIGNAPTALFHLLNMLEDPACPRPAAVALTPSMCLGGYSGADWRAERERAWQPGLPGLGATDPLFSHRRVADCAVRPGRCT